MALPMTAQLDRPVPAKSQATAIEQTRAIAEVQGAIVLAQNRPRNVAAAIGRMREGCQIEALAEKAFFRFPRGGQVVSGASVHLARELARCWGNIDYGAKELTRNDVTGESEMLAYAWDLETNARSSTTFIVPHKRDKRGGAETLTDMRDIYENNANNAARRLRECIFAILPPWFTEEAKGICKATLEHGGGKPLAQRVADCINVFKSIGITEEQLVKKTGRASGEWTPEDLASLTVCFKSIKAGEISKDDEFPRDEPPSAQAKLDALAEQAQQQSGQQSAAGQKKGKQTVKPDELPYEPGAEG